MTTPTATTATPADARFIAASAEGGGWLVFDLLAWDACFTRGPNNERIPTIYATEQEAIDAAAAKASS